MDSARFASLQALGSRTYAPQDRGWRHHPGQLAWSARYREGADAGPARTWREDGVLVGGAWVEEPTWIDVCLDRAHLLATDVARDAVGWALRHAADDEPVRTMVLEGEHLLLDVLAEAGFLSEAGPYLRHHFLDLDRLPAVPDLPDARLRAVVEGEAAARAACHRAAWNEPGRPSAVTTASYAALMETAPYRADLDWVAVLGDGSWVASCLVWLDPLTGVALVEPVGCAPGHRRRGLASAVSLAALHAAREAGATRALVCPRGDRDHPVPQALYQGLGFEPGERTVTLVREP